MIESGQRWINKEVHGTGPSWYYEDDPTKEWHYCDIADFFIWKTYKLIAP